MSEANPNATARKMKIELADQERKYVRLLLTGSQIPRVVGIFMCITWTVVALVPDDQGVSSSLGYWGYTIFMCIVSLAVTELVRWPVRHLSADFKAGEKAVETTTIQRLQKVGFFEMQADSALGIMAGAIYYLWIPDETRTPPQRRFRIGLTTYRQLMFYGNGSPIEVSYLPKSGIILSIDTPGYRYAAWESPDKRHQYKTSHLARD